MRSLNLRLFLAVFAVLVLTPAIAHAQGSSTATVTGTVTDQKGASVPGAAIELVNVATNESRTQRTNDTGYFTFVSVPPGTYRVSIKKDGFRATTIGPLGVQVGKSATVDAQLEIGTMAQTIEVQAGAQMELQTLDSAVGNVLERKMLDNIPSLARDATALLLLQPLANPGFNSPGSPNASGEGDNTGGQVAGARSDQNTFLLDGGDASDSTAGSGQYSGTNFTATPRAVVPTPIESLEEFRVVTTNSGASFSRSAGGEVQMVTRRGTNQYHGAVYEYLQNNVLNANTWTRNHLFVASTGRTEPNPALRDNRFGGRIGGPIWKDKTFFFVHYEGRRYVSSADISRRVPSALMKAGVLQFGGQFYNLNPGPVTVNGVTYPGTGATLDPRGLGLAPGIKAVWDMLPAGNDPTGSSADGVNTLGFTAPVPTPLREDFGVMRLDHAFNSRWQFMGSYRYDKTTFTAPVQVDIGGLLPGDTSGQPKATAQRPLAPRYVVAGLTGQVTSHLTSEFKFDYLRHWWQWGTFAPSKMPAPAGFPQPDGLNAALSILGEGITVGMQPINVDTQNARSRLWNGKDYTFIENMSWLKGNHLIQFGGRAGSQHFYHQRDDKVVGGLTSEVFTIGRLAAGSHVSGIPNPANLSGGAVNRWNTDYASVLGIMERAQQLFTRKPDFSPNPDGTPLQQHTVVDNYSLYVTDSWKLRPSLTLNIGVNWGVQLPPYEETGEQTMVVDDSTGKIVSFDDYEAQRKASALSGQIFNPQLDYVPIKQTGRKYPYDPDWTNFSPRVSVAWNPSFSSGLLSTVLGNRKTVVRSGYGRVYDRVNGVGIVMIPALGVGFGNNLRCAGPHNTGTAIACGSSTPSNGFRIGTDGTVVPMPALANIPSGQPLIPGTNSPFETLDFRIDPKRKIGYAHTFDLTVQRELPGNMLLEIGYVGNYASRLYQGYAAQQVPYMYTLGGQSLAKAFSNIAQTIIQNPNIARTAIPNQPFIEAFLAGQCGGYSSCTQMVVSDPSIKANANAFADDLSGFQTFNLTDFWEQYGSGLDSTQVLDSYIIGSHGHSNYNAGFLSLRKQTSAGLTFNFNYTLSHAFDQIGQNQESLNEASDAFNLDRDYGSAQFDRRHAFTALATYDLPFGRGSHFSSGSGIVNKIIGGWNIAGVWVFATGIPLDVFNGGSCQEFGQGAVFGNCSAYIPLDHKVVTASVNRNPSTGALSAFANSAAINSDYTPFFRPPDLTIDGRTGRGFYRGLNRWNFDFGASKTTKITERISTRFDMQITNAFNHPLFNNSNGVETQLDLSSGSFGRLNNQYNAPRFIQFGLRIDF